MLCVFDEERSCWKRSTSGGKNRLPDNAGLCVLTIQKISIGTVLEHAKHLKAQPQEEKHTPVAASGDWQAGKGGAEK